MRARSYRAMSQPSNGSTFDCTSGTMIRIPIPCGKSGTYLDAQSSYLSFKLTNLTTDGESSNGKDTMNSLALCNGAWCVIQELRVVSQGVTLSHINQYGMLHG